MNLPNKLTIFRMILVPIMVIIPFLGIQDIFLGIPVTYWLIDLIFVSLYNNTWISKNTRTY